MSIEVSIVMPCLNEAETVGICIKKAQKFLENHQIKGEVVIGDNGSTDGSQKIASDLGARVVSVESKGYGSASRGAINAAKGKFIITADTDDSHDLLNLDPFIEKLKEGYELVMGNRFKGEQKEDAMPFLHRYVGNPILSFIGNLFFKSDIGDFHCGLRGFTKEAYRKMNLNTTGMEFASEIVVKASLLKLRITEVPTTVFPSGRTRKAHLRTFPDGWRHLRFLLLYSPRWLFLLPGVLFGLIAIVSSLYLFINNSDEGVEFIPIASGLFLIAFQFVVFFALTKIYATNHGLLPRSKNYNKLFDYFTLERGLILGFLLLLLGLAMLFFANINETTILNNLKLIIPAMSILVLGIQLVLFSFFFSILGLTQQK